MSLLALGRRLDRPARWMQPRPRARSSGRERVLVVKLFGFGSLILAGPLLRNLRRHYARVDLLTLADHASLFAGMADRVLAVRRDLRGLGTVLGLDRYDVVVDLETASHLTPWLGLRGTRTVGLVAPGTTRRFGHEVRHDRGSVLQAMLDVLDVLGLPCDDGALEPVHIHEADRRRAAAVVPGWGYVVLNPNASALAVERRWDPARFAAIGRRLGDVVVIGGPADITLSEQVARDCGGRSVAGRLTLPQTADVLRRARLLVSNDSGPMHLGAAMGTRTIGLFGPESPERYAPPGITALWSAEPCSPCMEPANAKVVDCHRDAACMKAITVDDVLACA